jgi:molecular chaperone GrpE
MTDNTAENNTPENENMPEMDNVENLETANVETSPTAALEKERDDRRDKMMRALAEAENTRKRAEKTVSDTKKYAVTGFAKDMLDISDNLRRALDAISEDQLADETVKKLYDGVAATERMMLSNFEKQGIKKIEPTDGKFDPNFHEVMFEAETPGKQAGEIIQLLEAGYVLNDRLLRPARVGVAKSGTTEHKVDTQA